MKGRAPFFAIAAGALLTLAASGTALAYKGRASGQDRPLTGRIGSRLEKGDVAPVALPDASLLPGEEPSAVAVDRGYLFVVRGGSVYKVDESSLAVVAAGRLGSPAKRHRQSPAALPPRHHARAGDAR